MPTHKSYHSYLIESLMDPTEAAAYLDSVLEDGDLEHIVLALRNVTEARRDGINSLEASSETGEQLLTDDQPGLIAIATLLNDLGLKLSVTVKDSQPV